MVEFWNNRTDSASRLTRRFHHTGKRRNTKVRGDSQKERRWDISPFKYVLWGSNFSVQLVQTTEKLEREQKWTTMWPKESQVHRSMLSYKTTYGQVLDTSQTLAIDGWHQAWLNSVQQESISLCDLGSRCVCVCIYKLKVILYVIHGLLPTSRAGIPDQ